MTIQPVFYNTFSNRPYFEMTDGKRPWDIFLLLTEGSFSCRIGEEEYRIEANEVAYFPMNTSFNRKILSPISFHQLAFHADHTHPLYAALQPGKLEIPHENVDALAQSLALLSRCSDPQALLPHMIEHLMVEHSIHRQTATEAPQRLPEDLLLVLQYMNDHIHEKIDIDAIADTVHLSHVGLLWKFKRYTGMTLSRYLIHLRLNYAKQYLLEGDLPINEIALRCGYSNPYYFSNSFREQYGISPSRFRALHVHSDPKECVRAELLLPLPSQKNHASVLEKIT